MVDQLGHGKNHSNSLKSLDNYEALNPEYVKRALELTFYPTYKSETLFKSKPFKINKDQLFKMYYTRGLSAAQIAEELGVSKSCVMERIKRYRLKVPRNGRQTNPNNFRHPNPPYGYQSKRGKLVLNKKEVRVCRRVVQMIRDQGFGFREVARELEQQGFKTRKGLSKWSHCAVTQIYKRWSGRL